MNAPPGLTDRQQLLTMLPMFVGCGIGIVGGTLGTWWVAVFPAAALAAALWFWLQYRVIERQRHEVVAWLSSVFGPAGNRCSWELNGGQYSLDLIVVSDGVIAELYKGYYMSGTRGWRGKLGLKEFHDHLPGATFGVFKRPIASLHKTIERFYALDNSPEETSK